MKNLPKLNDLSNSNLKKRFLEESFVPETNYAVAMGRVSIKKNKDKGNSDVAQIQHITEYAEDNDLKIEKVWDVAETASKHNERRNFLDMIEYVYRNPKIKHVIFSHQSRSNRNRESARELEKLLSSGVIIHFARDRRTLSSKSDLEELLLWDVNNILNEKFIKDHIKNVMDGTFQRIEMGLYPGQAPFGYKNYRRDDQLSIFVLDGENAEYMKKAFEIFATGIYSIKDLGKLLSIQFPQLKTRPRAKRLYILLRSPFYYGHFQYCGVVYRGNPDYHPPLISFDLWKKVQDVFDQPHRNTSKLTTHNHHYTGLIKCGGRILDNDGNETDKICGHSVTGEEKRKKLQNGEVRKYYYWRCSNYRNRCSHRDQAYVLGTGRKTSYYSEKELESLMESVFTPLSFPDDAKRWIVESLKEHHILKKEDSEKLRSSLNMRMEMLVRYEDRAYEDKLQGNISEDMWREKFSKWRLERERIEAELKQLTDFRSNDIRGGMLLIELTQQFEIAYKNLPSADKRKLLEFVGSNYVLKDGTIEFCYKKPFNVFADLPKNEKWWRCRELNSGPKRKLRLANYMLVRSFDLVMCVEVRHSTHNTSSIVGY